MLNIIRHQLTIQNTKQLFVRVASTCSNYDVIVVGGGHAGIEAASACVRMGCNTLLATTNFQNIGEMSCNPSMGGIGKGHLMREIDALDGLIARMTDKAGIQFRVLNASKGEAVQGPRAQVDRIQYSYYMQRELFNTDLHFKQVRIDDLDIDTNTNTVRGVITSEGEHIFSKKVILTTGTFLGGTLHIGTKVENGGRYKRDLLTVDESSTALSNTLKNYMHIYRYTTGTPARLDKNTIDFSVLEKQYSDNPPIPFSFLSLYNNLPVNNPRLLPCHITYTNADTHAIIAKYRSLLPHFKGNGGKGRGPRYCPSIEKKVIRFPDKKQHMIWLEPEGLYTPCIYPNGLATAFPEDVQLEILQSMKGLENVHMIRPGYAVEYDYVPARYIYKTYENRALHSLYTAGQINGTTGYEEAAAQGIMAGINAALSIRKEEPFILNRSEAFLGVLADDITQTYKEDTDIEDGGGREPYRMFTSRGEYRLIMRSDNADIRLTEKGYKIGVVSKERYDMYKTRVEEYKYANSLFTKCQPPIRFWIENNVYNTSDTRGRTAKQVISYPGVKIDNVINALASHGTEIKPLSEITKQTLSIEYKYEPYIEKELKDVEAYKRNQELAIPDTIDYMKLPISQEERDKLSTYKPATIGDAMNIMGVKPSTLIAIIQLVRKHEYYSHLNTNKTD